MYTQLTPLQLLRYSAVPTIHLALLSFVESLPAPLDHSLRLIRSGAADLSVDAALRMQSVLEVSVLPSYSMTEQMPIAQVRYMLLLAKPFPTSSPI